LWTNRSVPAAGKLRRAAYAPRRYQTVGDGLATRASGGGGRPGGRPGLLLGRHPAAHGATGGIVMKETLWLRLFRGVRRLRQRADWLPFVGPQWADRIMGLVLHDRFHTKQGRSIVRWVLWHEDRRLTVYLKRHYRLPRWRGLLATVWPDAGWSPGVQEWQHLEWARARGMPVPAAVAAGEFI